MYPHAGHPQILSDRSIPVQPAARPPPVQTVPTVPTLTSVGSMGHPYPMSAPVVQTARATYGARSFHATSPVPHRQEASLTLPPSPASSNVQQRFGFPTALPGQHALHSASSIPPLLSSHRSVVSPVSVQSFSPPAHSVRQAAPLAAAGPVPQALPPAHSVRQAAPLAAAGPVPQALPPAHSVRQAVQPTLVPQKLAAPTQTVTHNRIVAPMNRIPASPARVALAQAQVQAQAQAEAQAQPAQAAIIVTSESSHDPVQSPAPLSARGISANSAHAQVVSLQGVPQPLSEQMQASPRTYADAANTFEELVQEEGFSKPVQESPRVHGDAIDTFAEPEQQFSCAEPAEVSPENTFAEPEQQFSCAEPAEVSPENDGGVINTFEERAEQSGLLEHEDTTMMRSSLLDQEDTTIMLDDGTHGDATFMHDEGMHGDVATMLHEGMQQEVPGLLVTGDAMDPEPVQEELPGGLDAIATPSFNDIKLHSGLQQVPVDDVVKAMQMAGGDSGKLSRDDFCATYSMLLQHYGIPTPSEATQHAVFDVFDRDHNHVVDLWEVFCGVSLFCKGTQDDKVRAVFNAFDLNGDGAIGMDEMIKLLSSIYKVLLTDDVKAAMAAVGAPVESAHELAATTAMECFKSTDLNDDHKLSFGEFSRWFKLPEHDPSFNFEPVHTTLHGACS